MKWCYKYHEEERFLIYLLFFFRFYNNYDSIEVYSTIGLILIL